MKSLHIGYALLCLLTASSVNAGSFNPFFGADYQFTHLRNQNTTLETKHKFKNDFKGYGVFIGNRFPDNWAIELSSQRTNHAERITEFVNGERFGGSTQSVGATLHTTTVLRSYNFDIDGFFDFSKYFALIGQIGLAWANPQINAIHTSAVNEVGSREQKRLMINTRRKFLWRFGFGGMLNITKWFSIRGLFRWQSTSRLVISMIDNDNNIFTGIKPFKNSYTASLGALLQF